MPNQISAVIGAIFLIMFAIPATHAADFEMDLDNLIMNAPIMTVQPVGGWYLRGDLTYHADKPLYDDGLSGGEVKKKPMGGSIGVGYQFNDLVRFDANIGLISGAEINAGGSQFNNRIYGGLVNGYVDIGTIAGFTPYIGAGVGVLRSTNKASGDWGGLADSLQQLGKQQNAFAYSVSAGAAYGITEKMSIDLGYQYIHSSSLNYLNFESGKIDQGVDYHQLRLGLRLRL